VGEILKIVAESSGETFQPEFDLKTRRDKKRESEKSPDGFLSGRVQMIFEVKFTRYPRPVENNWTHAALTAWLGKLTGQTDRRLPLQQGLNFFEVWHRGNQECIRHLGEFPGIEALYYIIISIEDPPLASHWEDYRCKIWKGDFNTDQKELLDRTIILSIQDIEALAHLVYSAAHKGLPLKTDDLLDEWQREWRNKGLTIPIDHKGNYRFNDSFGRFIKKRYEHLFTEARPEFFERNLKQFWSEMEKVVFMAET
jgi:hypothetical protein